MSNDNLIERPDEDRSSSGVVTIVLRLLRRPLDRGELVGRAEIVATGEVGDVHGMEDIVRLAAPPD